MKTLSKKRRRQLDKAVKLIVEKYGDVLVRLGRT